MELRWGGNEHCMAGWACSWSRDRALIFEGWMASSPLSNNVTDDDGGSVDGEKDASRERFDMMKRRWTDYASSMKMSRTSSSDVHQQQNSIVGMSPA